MSEHSQQPASTAWTEALAQTFEQDFAAATTLGPTLPYPHSHHIGGYVPGEFSMKFVAEARRSTREEVRLAGVQMQRSPDDSPISRHLLPPDFVDPMPLPASRRVRGYLWRAVGKTVHDNRPPMLAADETPMPQNRLGRIGTAFMGICAVAALGASAYVMNGGFEHEDASRQPAATYRDQQIVANHALTSTDALNALGLCGDELQAEAAWKAYKAGTPDAQPFAADAVRPLQNAANLANAAHVPCRPLDGKSVYTEYIGSTKVTIMPSMVSSFDVDSVCADLSWQASPEIEPVVANDGDMQRRAQLNLELAQAQHMEC